MATKKLRAELEVDTTKAKQKVRELSESGGGSAGEAANEISKLGDAAKETTVKLSRSGQMFAGLAMGMARAASAADPDTANALGAVSNIMSAAAVGGIPGMAVAAITEAITAAIGASVEESKKMMMDAQTKMSNLNQIKMWDEARSRTLAFKETLEQLTNVETDLAERQSRLAEEIRKREEAEEKLHKEAFRETGDPAAFARAMAKRQTNAAELDQLREMEKRGLDKASKGGGGFGGGVSWNAADSLSSVGGMFAGGGAGARALDDIASSTAETVKVLKNIDKNTQGGGATWQ